MFFINLDIETAQRYDLEKFIEHVVDCHDPINSNLLQELPKLEPMGYYTIRAEEYRPDLLSHKIYGNSMYWHILMFYNGLVDIEELTSGTVLKYPSLGDIEAIYFSLLAASL